MNKKPSNVLFVTDEYYPINNGGIARLINTAANELTSSKQHVTILICIEDTESVISYRSKNKNEYLTIYSVNELLNGSQYSSEFPTWMPMMDKLHTSYRCALAIRTLCNTHQFEMIEFNDCWGLGYVYLKWRKLFNDEFTKIPSWIRLHGTMENCMKSDLINENDFFYPYHYNFFEMEKKSLLMSDGIISPSISVANWYIKDYQLPNIDIVSSTPSFEKIGQNMIHPRKIVETPFKVLYYGRIQHLKGVDNLIDAVIKIFYENKISIQVELIGKVINNYDQYLLNRIPDELKPNFKFVGLIDPKELPNYALKSNVAIITSRTETFCLAAHELNWIGIPLILNKIAAFKDFFDDNKNCLIYDNTSESLANKILDFYSSNKCNLENNAQEIAKQHDANQTYKELKIKNKIYNINDKYEVLTSENYLSLFCLLTLVTLEEKDRKNISTSVNNFYIPNIFSPIFYSKTSIENLNVITLLLNSQGQKTTDYSKELNDITEFYNNEYEVLPLWYKRVGHIIKVATGKRSFKSLFN